MQSVSMADSFAGRPIHAARMPSDDSAPAEASDGRALRLLQALLRHRQAWTTVRQSALLHAPQRHGDVLAGGRFGVDEGHFVAGEGDPADLVAADFVRERAADDVDRIGPAGLADRVGAEHRIALALDRDGLVLRQGLAVSGRDLRRVVLREYLHEMAVAGEDRHAVHVAVEQVDLAMSAAIDGDRHRPPGPDDLRLDGRLLRGRLA